MNKSGIKPVEYRVLVKLDDVKHVSKGGIIFVPETIDNKRFSQEKGTLIAFGGSAFEDFPEKEEFQPGTRIMLSKYAGVKVRGVDGETYQLSNDKDVTAILTEEEENEQI